MPDQDHPQSHTSADVQAPEPDRAERTSDFSTPDPAGSATVTAPAAPPRFNAGRFEVLAEIARAGMGVVYRAHDPAVNRDVAVKVLQERFRNHPVAIRRFVEEGQITGQLQHPGAPAIHEIGTLPDGSPFLAMKLVKGVTLANQIAAPSPDRGGLVAVFLQVAQAVGYAHSKGVIHRDLKPANVMVGQFGEVQVMDWGLAKVLSKLPSSGPRQAEAPTQYTFIETGRSSDPGLETQAGSVLGTPAYMSPEQAGGEVELVDERADVFGLGAVLCTILTGDPPFRDRTVEAVRLRAVRGQVEDAYARLDQCGAGPELVALCKRCLMPDRDSRPRNAAEVAAAVSAHLAAVEDRLRSAERDRTAAQVKAAEQRKRRRWQAAVAGAAMLILALLGVGKWWMDRQAAERDKDRAVAAERDRQEALAALVRAEQALGSGDLALADVALAQAEGRVGADGPADLAVVLTTARRDRDFVRDMREIEDLSWAPGYINMPDAAAMASRYRAMFVKYGLDVDGVGPGAAADVVLASRVSAALVAGLGEWFTIDPKQPNLRQLLDRLDPDATRAEIRSAIAARDEGRARALVGALDGSRAPAWFAVSVGFHPMVPFEDGVRLMTAAWRAHPTDYSLAYRISQRLWATRDDRLPEMLTWARVAVALWPDSPSAHIQLAMAWRGMRNWSEAEASARRAIELGRNYPRHIRAHVTLGNVLLQKGDLDGAEASYRTAMAIDPDAIVMCYNMGLLNQIRGDLAAAEEWYRKAVARSPTTAYSREVLDQLVQKRARLKEIPHGRANPADPDEAIEFAEAASRPPRRRYVLAVRCYSWLFRTDPARADDLGKGHRYNAACCAAMAAAGKDEEMTTIGVEEWGDLTGLALKWLRADLALRASQAKGPKRSQEIRERLAHWKKDPNLASVRDPACLAAMSPSDRKAWEALWADVDTVLPEPPGRLRSLGGRASRVTQALDSPQSPCLQLEAPQNELRPGERDGYDTPVSALGGPLVAVGRCRA
jgi:tetratricopeptide (TPR) repeat protein